MLSASRQYRRRLYHSKNGDSPSMMSAELKLVGVDAVEGGLNAAFCLFLSMAQIVYETAFHSTLYDELGVHVSEPQPND